MVDWPLMLAGMVSLVPGLLVLLLSYTPYDGHFKDNLLFLFFMGGIFAGMVVVVFELLLLLPGDALYRVAMVLVGFPVLEQALKLAVLNRRSFQGERTTTFYGGSFGLGFATMAVLFKAQRDIVLPYPQLGDVLAQPAPLLYLLAVGLAILLAHFATGLIVGDAVRTRDIRGGLVRAVVALVPLQALVFEFTAGSRAGRASEGLVYLPLLLAYAAGLAWWAHARLLPKALPPDAQRKRRRALLARRRAEGP